jgi:hypothetical protein
MDVVSAAASQPQAVAQQHLPTPDAGAPGGSSVEPAAHPKVEPASEAPGGPVKEAPVGEGAEVEGEAGPQSPQSMEEALDHMTLEGNAAQARMAKGEDDEEDEEEDDEELQVGEIRAELDELAASQDRTEQERRLAFVLKRLMAYQVANRLGVNGTQTYHIECSLVDYPLLVWRPETFGSLVTKLKDGEFAEEGAGLERFTHCIHLMCRNSWCCNIEDSESWSAAEKFLAVYDRLLKAWILERERPPLEELNEERCGKCHMVVDRMAVKVCQGQNVPDLRVTGC